MPMSLLPDSGRKGRVAIVIFAFCSPLRLAGDGSAVKTGFGSGELFGC
jgi:hypothetical protein